MTLASQRRADYKLAYGDLPPYKFTKAQEKWLQALESGKYRKGTCNLRTISDTEAPDSFCCLGVASDLFIPKRKQRASIRGIMVYGDSSLRSGACDDTYAPVPVMHKLKLHNNSGGPTLGSSSPYLSSSDTWPSLIVMNDGSPMLSIRRHSHREIAAHLRRYPYVYFQG